MSEWGATGADGYALCTLNWVFKTPAGTSVNLLLNAKPRTSIRFRPPPPAIVPEERASREASELGSLLIRRKKFSVGHPGHIAPLYVSHESWRGRGPELIFLAKTGL
jgi:hypothetical protein